MNNSHKYSILIAVNSLQQGGAELAAIKLATSLHSDGHSVKILTWNDKKDFFQLPQDIPRLNLDPFILNKIIARALPAFMSHRISLVLKLLKFRRLARKEKVDTFIGFESFLGSVLSLALVGTRIASIVAERISPNPEVHEVPKLAKILRPFLYKHGVICSVQSRGFAAWVENNWKISPVITPNHLLNEWIGLAIPENRLNKVVALGRFDAQKDYATLLKAWQIVEQINREWFLDIYGRGEITNSYFLANELGLKNVTFHPASKNPGQILKEAGIFVSTSIYEGFPNVVLEAMANAVPTISTLSTDIITEFSQKNALIPVHVGDFNSLADSIIKLISSESLRKYYSENGHELAQKFSWEGVSNEWYSAIERARVARGVKN